MAQLEVRSLERADERRPFAGRGYADVVNVEGRAVMRGVFEPGWRWSEHVKADRRHGDLSGSAPPLLPRRADEGAHG